MARAQGVLWSQSAAFAAPKPRQQESASSPAGPTISAAQSSTEQSLQAVTDDIAASIDPEIERKREQSAAAAWGGAAPSEASAAELGGDSGGSGGAEGGGGGGGGAPKSALGELSLEDLQAELERRKQAAGN